MICAMITTIVVKPSVALGFARIYATAPLKMSPRVSGRSGMTPGLSAGGYPVGGYQGGGPYPGGGGPYPGGGGPYPGGGGPYPGGGYAGAGYTVGRTSPSALLMSTILATARPIGKRLGGTGDGVREGASA